MKPFQRASYNIRLYSFGITSTFNLPRSFAFETQIFRAVRVEGILRFLNSSEGRFCDALHWKKQIELPFALIVITSIGECEPADLNAIIPFALASFTILLSRLAPLTYPGFGIEFPSVQPIIYFSGAPVAIFLIAMDGDAANFQLNAVCRPEFAPAAHFLFFKHGASPPFRK
jgi:hypothetical protein